MFIDFLVVFFLSFSVGICLVGLNRVVKVKDWYEDVYDCLINVFCMFVEVKFFRIGKIFFLYRII